MVLGGMEQRRTAGSAGSAARPTAMRVTGSPSRSRASRRRRRTARNAHRRLTRATARPPRAITPSAPAPSHTLWRAWRQATATGAPRQRPGRARAAKAAASACTGRVACDAFGAARRRPARRQLDRCLHAGRVFSAWRRALAGAPSHRLGELRGQSRAAATRRAPARRRRLRPARLRPAAVARASSPTWTPRSKPPSPPASRALSSRRAWDAIRGRRRHGAPHRRRAASDARLDRPVRTTDRAADGWPRAHEVHSTGAVEAANRWLKQTVGQRARHLGTRPRSVFGEHTA
jgi:hypothetical protein